MKEEILDEDFAPLLEEGISKVAIGELIVVLLVVFSQWALVFAGESAQFYGRMIPLLLFLAFQAFLPFFRLRSSKRRWLAILLAVLNLMAWGGFCLGALFKIESWMGGSLMMGNATLILIAVYLISPVNDKFYGKVKLGMTYVHLFTAAWALAFWSILMKFESISYEIPSLVSIALNSAAIIIISISMFRKEIGSHHYFNYLPKAIFFLYWVVRLYV